MTDNARRFDPVAKQDCFDFLALFPSEVDEPGEVSMLSSPKKTVATIADFAAEPRRVQASHPSPAAPVAPAPKRRARPAVSGRWLACLVFIPSLAILALHQMSLLPLLSTGESSDDAAIVLDNNLPAPRGEDVRGAPAPPPPSPRAEAERIVTPPPPEATSSGIATVPTATSGPQRTPPSVPAARESSRREPAASGTLSPAASAKRTLLDVTLLGENVPAAVPPAARATSSRSVKFLGSISLKSEPAGARVLVDGVVVGVTPLSRWELPAGSHIVRVEMDGYRRWSAAVQVITGQTLSLVASLQPGQ